MWKFIITVFLITMAAVFPARADHVPTHGSAAVTQESFEALLEKLKTHPEIAAYASRVEASGEYAKGELGLPDPMVFLEQEDYRFRSSDMGRGGGDTMFGFRQEIPNSGLRKAQSARMNAESGKNRLLQEYAYSAMKARMISALAQMHKIEELTRIAQEQKKLLKTQRQSLKGSVAANRAAVSTVSMTEAETAETDIILAELDEEKHEIEAMLTNMLGYTPKIPDMPAIEMLTWDRNVDNTYPVLAAAADITMADKDVDIRKAQYGPNFEIQASAGRMDGGDQGGTIMLGVSMPLWSSGNQAPKLRGAKAALAAAKLDQDMIRRNMMQKLVHLQAQIDTSIRKIELSEKKELLLKEAAKAASREYEAGKGEFVMILKTRREAFAARAQTMVDKARHASLVAEFNKYIRKEN